MMWTIVVMTIIIVLIIIIILNYGRLKRNRKIAVFKIESRRITDSAVKFALDHLHSNKYGIESHILKVTEIVSKIWGKKVMVFEYQFKMTNPSKENIEKIRGKFSDSFEEFEMMDLIKKDVGAVSAFEITDLWYLDGLLHLDVAYLVNDETVMYTKDLKKV